MQHGAWITIWGNKKKQTKKNQSTGREPLGVKYQPTRNKESEKILAQPKPGKLALLSFPHCTHSPLVWKI